MKKQIGIFSGLLVVFALFTLSVNAQSPTKWKINFESGTQIVPVEDSTNVALAYPATTFKIWPSENGCNDYFYIVASEFTRDTIMVSYIPEMKEVVAEFKGGELTILQTKER